MDTRANNPSSAGNSKRTSTGIIIARSSQVWRGCFVRSRYGGAYLKFDGARAGTKSLCLVYVSLRGSALILRRAPLKTRPDFHRLRLAWTSGGLIRLSSGKFAVYFDRHGHLIRPFA